MMKKNSMTGLSRCEFIDPLKQIARSKVAGFTRYEHTRILTMQLYTRLYHYSEDFLEIPICGNLGDRVVDLLLRE